MNVRQMATERLLVVSTRLLAAASVLTTVALAVNTWLGWQQIGQSYGPDGTPTAGEMSFTTKVSMAVFESSFRPAGLQLVLAGMLLAGAVAALHRHPSGSRAGSLRWEVLGAGLVALVVVIVLLLAHLFVIAAPAGGDDDPSWFVGPQSIEQVALANLMTLGAALVVLVVVALFWLRLGTVPDDAVDSADSADEEVGEAESGFAPDREAPEAVRRPHSVDAMSGEPMKDYSRDWSPEDFLPPR